MSTRHELSPASTGRCCFGCCRLQSRYAGALIGLIDFILMSVPLARGIQLYLTIRSNPIITGWFIASAMLYALHVVCIAAAWYGIARRRSLWLLPKLILKLFTVALCTGAIALFIYLIYIRSRLLVNIVTQHTELGYYTARSTVQIGGTLLIGIFVVFTLVQMWFFTILLDCYRHIREIELNAIVEKYLARDRNNSTTADNHQWQQHQSSVNRQQLFDPYQQQLPSDHHHRYPNNYESFMIEQQKPLSGFQSTIPRTTSTSAGLSHFYKI